MAKLGTMKYEGVSGRVDLESSPQPEGWVDI